MLIETFMSCKDIVPLSCETYQGKEVCVAVFQGGSVCLKVDICHFLIILSHLPLFTPFLDVLKGSKNTNFKKMCLSPNYSLMAVA